MGQNSNINGTINRAHSTCNPDKFSKIRIDCLGMASLSRYSLTKDMLEVRHMAR
jgi:hypothetical protein